MPLRLDLYLEFYELVPTTSLSEGSRLVTKVKIKKRWTMNFIIESCSFDVSSAFRVCLSCILTFVNDAINDLNHSLQWALHRNEECGMWYHERRIKFTFAKVKCRGQVVTCATNYFYVSPKKAMTFDDQSCESKMPKHLSYVLLQITLDFITKHLCSKSLDIIPKIINQFTKIIQFLYYMKAIKVRRQSVLLCRN